MFAIYMKITFINAKCIYSGGTLISNYFTPREK